MPKNKGNSLRVPNRRFRLIFFLAGKGGKNRRRGKNENESEKRELVFKEHGQGKRRRNKGCRLATFYLSRLRNAQNMRKSRKCLATVDSKRSASTESSDCATSAENCAKKCREHPKLNEENHLISLSGLDQSRRRRSHRSQRLSG